AAKASTEPSPSEPGAAARVLRDASHARRRATDRRCGRAGCVAPRRRAQASSDQCLASPRIDRSPASIAVARTPSAPHANDALLPNASKTLAALAPLGPQAAHPVTAAGRHR
ncbi:hypothetical protein ACX84U_01565, partial [Burkholderia pseudomallei]